MDDFLYDGSFEGMLSAVYAYYYSQGTCSGIFKETNYQASMLNGSRIIMTEKDKAETVRKAVSKKISSMALTCIYYCFLSNTNNSENLILDMLVSGFRLKGNIIDYYSHPSVKPVVEAADRVKKEKHSFMGLLRFRSKDNTYFAQYSPDNDITELLMPHFAQRMKSERFIIFDSGRKKAGAYSEGEWIILNDIKIEINKYDDFTENAWKKYFDSISIKQRKNLKIQYQKVPVRYRKDIVEFNL